MEENDLFREANELKAWIEVNEDGEVGGAAIGRRRIGVTRLKLCRREIAFPAVKYPVIQAEPEQREGGVRFVQSAGGHMGLPAPRRVVGKPLMRIHSASAWTTLELMVQANGSSEGRMVGASPFPRHWVYDADGVLVEKSASVDSRAGTASRTASTRPGATRIRRRSRRGRVGARAGALGLDHARGREARTPLARAGEPLVEQGEEGRELFLILDGIVDVKVDGNEVAELGLER